VRGATGLLLTVTAVRAMAATGMPATGMPATAYVSDELVLGVYAEENSQGQRLATLHSGAALEALGVSGEFTQVRLPDGVTGWVKTSYLTAKEPAVVRIKQLEEDLDRSRATTPALAEAAARNEVLQLQRELDEVRSAAVDRPPQPGSGGSGSSLTLAPLSTPAVSPWLAACGMAGTLVAGFWLGYATLARRVRSRFGGLKVY
jgi:SH3-like domain-containing protein